MNKNLIKYNLFLISADKVLFVSNDSHLTPLINCLKKYKNYPKDCLLYDKIIGLAAARLIIYSKVISIVITNVISKQAKELLKKNKIKIYSKNVVKNILNNNRSGPCPMELKAIRANNNMIFFKEMTGIKK